MQDVLRDIYARAHKVGFQGCESGTCLVLEPAALSRASRAEITRKLKDLDTRSEDARPVCFFRGTAERTEFVGGVRLAPAHFEVLTGILPGFSGARLGVAIDLRAGGLTDDPSILALNVAAIERQPSGKDVVKELTALARRGKVVLRAQLARRPAKDRTTIARIPTDDGTLGVKVLMSEALGLTPKDLVVFSTPRNRSFVVALATFDNPQQVISNLTTVGGLLRTRTLSLDARPGKNRSFFVEYTATEGNAVSLWVEVGAVPLDARGRALGPSVRHRWTPRIRVQRVMTDRCDFEVSFDGVGNPAELAPLTTYYPDDALAIRSILQFDPTRQAVATQFRPDTLCGPLGEVP